MAAEAKLFEDKAMEAFSILGETPEWEEWIYKWRNQLQGKINSLRWIPSKEGTTEVFDVKFPDNTAIRVSRFIRKTDKTVHTKIARVKGE